NSQLAAKLNPRTRAAAPTLPARRRAGARVGMTAIETIKPSQTAVETKLAYRWVILAVLWITYIVVFLNRLSVGPLSPFFKEELQLTSAQVGFVMSIAAIGYLTPHIPVGCLVDRIGARWPLAFGEFIAAAAMFALFFVGSYPALLGLMFVTGAGCGFLTPATTQGVVVWFPQNERATVMGFKQTAVNLGGM